MSAMAYCADTQSVKTYWLGYVEAREDVPGGDEGGEYCGSNLKVGGQVDAHDAHMGEVVQGEQQEQKEPEEFACMHTLISSSWHAHMRKHLSVL